MTDDELIALYLDDSLSQDQAAELRKWLYSDSANVLKLAKATARDEQLRAAVVSLETLRDATGRPAFQACVAQRASRPRSIMPWAFATSLAIFMIAWFAIPRSVGESTLTLVDSTGAVSFRIDDEGEEPMTAGMQLSAGTLVVEGDGARAEFSYPDGSTLSLFGGSVTKVSNVRGKQLFLKRGDLSASVPHQPSKRPLLVRTATAEATVLGTSFGISADQSETLLQVNSGSVKMRRLLDDQEVVVGGNQQVRTVDTDIKPLLTEPMDVIPDSWHADFQIEQGLTWIGERRDGVLAGNFRSTYSRELNVHSEHFHAGAYNKLQGLVTLYSDSAVSVRYRISEGRNIGVFISTHLSSWEFSGNFEGYLIHDKIVPNAEGWREATIPLTSFYARSSMKLQSGCKLSAIYLTTYERDIGLAISYLEVGRVEEE